MGQCNSSEKGGNVPDVVFDLENINSEDKRYQSVLNILNKSSKILQSITDYKGCDEQIKEALSDPTPETENIAWKAVEKAVVDSLYKYYKYSQSLDDALGPILGALCTEVIDEDFHANVYLLARILHFSFKFDETKMIKPAIQNDFSYYRRVWGRMGANGKSNSKKKKGSKKPKVDADIANKMSFHFAYPTPVIKALIDKAQKYHDPENLAKGLSLIANISANMIQNNDKNPMLYSLMTGCIIFVDHLLPDGAFHKRSPVRIIQCITLLRDSEDPTLHINSLRFSTTNLSKDAKDTTHSTIKKMIL